VTAPAISWRTDEPSLLSYVSRLHFHKDRTI